LVLDRVVFTVEFECVGANLARFQRRKYLPRAVSETGRETVRKREVEFGEDEERDPHRTYES
jgi:hypothetical protein